jgi:hypothetical protein
MDSQHADTHGPVARAEARRCWQARVEGYVNGKRYLQHDLPQAVSGRVGLWSKADSVVYFDDYRVQ